MDLSDLGLKRPRELELPLVTASKQRKAVRTIAPAASRTGTKWLVKLHAAGRRSATCMQCKEIISAGMCKVGKQSDVKTGGRWLHPQCIPGGLRLDDCIETDDIDPAPSVQQFITDHLTKVAAHNTTHVPPAASSQSNMSAPIGAPALKEPSLTVGSSASTPATPTVADQSEFTQEEEDWIPLDVWRQVATMKLPMLESPPTHLRPVCAASKANLIRSALSHLTTGSVEDRTQKWLQILLFDKFVFNTAGERGTGLNAKIRRRLKMIDEGHWLQLVWETMDAADTGPASQKSTDIAKRIKRITKLASEGSWRRALAATTSQVAPSEKPAATWTKIRAELPSHSRLCPSCSEVLPLTDEDKGKLRQALLSALKGGDPTASPGILGSGIGLWQPLLAQEDDTAAALDFFHLVAIGDMPRDIRRLIMTGDLSPIQRPDGRVRPVIVPNTVGKIALSSLVKVLTPKIKSIVGPWQFGIAEKDGTTKAFSALQNLALQHPDHIVLSTDAGGAHSKCNRDTIDDCLMNADPCLQWILRTWYGEGTSKLWRAADMTRILTTETGLDQGHPPAAALFCVALDQAIKKTHLDISMPPSVAFQDDVYWLVKPEDLDRALEAITTHWAEMGITVNQKKLAIWSASSGLAGRVPVFWKDKVVPSLKVLGQRMQVTLDPEGLPLILGSDNPLHAAHSQLQALQTGLFYLCEEGLSPAIAHEMWLYASTGAITHLLACNHFPPDQLSQLDTLQLQHLRWIIARSPDPKTQLLASLPAALGGIGLPSYSTAAPALFLAAQGRTIPVITQLMGWGSHQRLLEGNPKLRDNIAAARSALIGAGTKYFQLPFGASNPLKTQSTKDMLRPVHLARHAALVSQLAVPSQVRLKGQACAEAGAWIHMATPGGAPKPANTWRTMMRLRLLLPAPGTAQPPEHGSTCNHCLADGTRCPHQLDDAGTHEILCAAGGLIDARHHRTRDWVAEKCHDELHCKISVERDVTLPLVTRAGRMDLIVHRADGPLLIDTVIASCATSNQEELSRRLADPTRALRDAETRKRNRYGAAVLPVAIEDTGRLGNGTKRLLRMLARQAEDPGVSYRQLAGELQSLVLAATASLLQAARGEATTT